MKSRLPTPPESTAETGLRAPFSSPPRGATGERSRPLPRGLFPSPPHARKPAHPEQDAMNATRMNALGRYAARAAIVVAGVYLAIAVGAPWLLYSAPPSPQDVVAAQVCCFKPPGAGDARTARP
jgi:hypothetical protein